MSKYKNLPEDQYGLPKRKAYPMQDKKHVELAVKFFNRSEYKDEKELANNIKRRAKELGVAISCGKSNRLSKYLTEFSVCPSPMVGIVNKQTEYESDPENLGFKYFADEYGNPKRKKKKITAVAESAILDNYYIISDIHCGHDDEEKFRYVIEQLNSKAVTDNDTLIINGDISSYETKDPVKDIEDLIPQLNYRNIILIKGNHDKEKDSVYKNAGISTICDRMIIGDVVLAHIPLKKEDFPPGCIFNIHAHIHGIHYKGKSSNYCTDPSTHFDVWKDNYEPTLLLDIFARIGVGPEDKISDDDFILLHN